MKMSADRNEWKRKIKAILYYKGIKKEEESGKVNYIRPVKHLSFSEKAGRWGTGQQMESKVAVHHQRQEEIYLWIGVSSQGPALDSCLGHNLTPWHFLVVWKLGA